MKLRKIRIQNARSFLDSAELVLDGNISIIVGPNGGGKTNLLDIAVTALRRHITKAWDFRKDGQKVVMGESAMIAGAVIDRHYDGVMPLSLIHI